MQIEKEDRHVGRVVRTSIGTMTQVSIKVVEKGTRKPKGVQEYRTKHKTRSAHNTGRMTCREESIHTRHRLMQTGKQTMS